VGGWGPSDREREERLRSEARQAGEGGFKLKMPGEGNFNLSHCYGLMLVPAVDAHSLEKDHRSAGEHLKCNTK